MKKRIFAVLTAIFLLCACLPLSVSAEQSGTIGDCTWTLDDKGHLTISGKGKMGQGSFSSASITSVTIEDGVTTIGDSAFSRCTSLTSVTIPDSVTTIGYRAFSNCISLTSVTIPDSVTTIGGEAFSDTAYYNTSSNWENDLLYIGNHLVTAKKSLSSSCNIKNGTLTIGGGAFYECTFLTSVTIPDSVTTIGEYAFRDCTFLTSVTIPDSVTTIGEQAFAYCYSLTSVTIPDSVTTIVESAFSGCDSLTDVYYGGDKTDRAVISIGSYNDPLQNATWHYEDADKDGKNDEEGQSAEGGFNGWIVVAVVSWITNAVLLITNAALLFLLLKKRKSAPKSE